jgi:glycyl-tRNA synthetase beta chain
MARLVLEIGTEEIPPRYFPVALPALAEQGKAMLERARLSFREAKVYGTPRRLVFIAEDMAAVQSPKLREERGPAMKVAFDAEGKPTRAAEGFARRWGLTPGKLERRQTGQGEYVFAVIQEPELPAAQALAPLLPGLITSIPFPKTMRWGTGKLRFGRPIRWLLALVDEEVVEFELDGIRSGRLTRGHPVLAEGMYEVGEAAEYEKVLEGQKVVVDPDARREILRKTADELADAAGGIVWFWSLPGPMTLTDLVKEPYWFEWGIQNNLILRAAFLVEWPTAGIGHFEEAYLALPEPILEAEMVHVQEYFPVRKRLVGTESKGRLLPCFVAVRDGGSDCLNEVVRGWESVLRSKLEDARYFYDRDRRVPLSDRLQGLRGVVLQEKLGSVYDKVQRVGVVARHFAGQLHLPVRDRDLLGRAALLAKADLTTELVAELPTLQGVIGRHYALLSGEPVAVADAIEEHYRPRHARDDTPWDLLSTILAISDKLDTVVACLSVGIRPTGSSDPLGLRREGIGLVRCFAEFPGLPGDPEVSRRFAEISVSGLARTALAELRRQVEVSSTEDQIVEEVAAFLAQRLETYLREKRRRYDIVRAALAVGADKVRDAADRVRALQDLCTTPGFLPTVIATTRVINISKDFEGGGVDPGLFQEESERALWQAYQEALGKAEGASLGDLFGLIADIRGAIDRFFDEVLVMHEDERIRRNRLALCWHINHDLFRRLADFSLIVQG